MKSQKFGITLHLTVLILACLLSPPSFERLFSSPDGFLHYLLSLFFLLAMFYICFLWLVPAYLTVKRTALFVLLVFVAANLVTFIGYSSLQLSHRILTHSGEGFFYSAAMHFSGFHAITMAALFGTLFRVVYEWYRIIPAEKHEY
jgi:hypothetical protein